MHQVITPVRRSMRLNADEDYQTDSNELTSHSTLDESTNVSKLLETHGFAYVPNLALPKTVGVADGRFRNLK